MTLPPIKVHYPLHLPYAERYRARTVMLQGLANSARMSLVPTAGESDFVFLNCVSLADHDYAATCAYDPAKLVFFDWFDDPARVYSNIRCLAYFKRSWVLVDGARKEAPPRPGNFHPIGLSILDEFLNAGEAPRTIDVGAYFGDAPGVYRARVKEIVASLPARWHRWVGLVSPDGFEGRANFNPEYFAALRRTRIVVTCQPDAWEGDWRTWEALASGALVAVDRMATPMRHPLRDREHCIIYDRTDAGFEYLRQSILYYLAHPDEAAALARRGYDYAMQHHRPVHRIDEALAIALAARTHG